MVRRDDAGTALGSYDERTHFYRAVALLAETGTRAVFVELQWAAHLSASRRRDAVRIEGHLRMCVTSALALAADLARTREQAEAKVSFLALMMARLGHRVEGPARRDHNGAVMMLAAAGDVETRRWGLLPTRPRPDERRIGSRGSEPDPLMVRRLRRNARPRTLAEAEAEAEVMHADGSALVASGDWAVKGVPDQVRASLLHSLAIPVTSIDELEAKIRAISSWRGYMRPSELTRPMLRVVLAADCERLGWAFNLAPLFECLSPDAGA